MNPVPRCPVRRSGSRGGRRATAGMTTLPMMLEPLIGPPEAAVAGDRPVVTHQRRTPRAGREMGLAWWQRVSEARAGHVAAAYGLGEPPAVDVEDAACRVDGLARQRDDALDEVGPRHAPGQWSRGGWVNTTMSPSRTWCQLKNAFCTRMPVVDVERRHHGGAGDREGLEHERPDAERQQQRQRQADGPSGQRCGALTAAPCERQAGRPPRAREPGPGRRGRRRSQQWSCRSQRSGAPRLPPCRGSAGREPPCRGSAGRGWAVRSGRCVSGSRSPHWPVPARTAAPVAHRASQAASSSAPTAAPRRRRGSITSRARAAPMR